jgi:tRNA(fMet)-specific endonuclease VapC
MRFLLDANAWIGHFRQTSPTVTSHLSQHAASDIALCSMVLAELLYGAERSGPAHRPANFALITGLRQQYVSLPFDDPAAEEYGRIRAHLANQGTPIGPNDLIIAAIALANRLALVTHNTLEFSRIPGLQLEDWQVP